MRAAVWFRWACHALISTQRAAARTAEELRERRASRQLCLLAAEKTKARPLSLRGPRRHFSPVTVSLWAQAQSGLRPSSIEGRTMAKLKFIAVILTAPMAGIAAYAQDNGGYVAPERSRPTPGHLLNQDYLTSTGETVPRPGVPESWDCQESCVRGHTDADGGRIWQSRRTPWTVCWRGVTRRLFSPRTGYSTS